MNVDKYFFLAATHSAVDIVFDLLETKAVTSAGMALKELREELYSHMLDQILLHY